MGKFGVRHEELTIVCFSSGKESFQSQSSWLFHVIVDAMKDKTSRGHFA
jgi:hypothetical protein